MRKYFFLVLILSISMLDAKHLALLISTEDGYPLHTDKDVSTMQKILGNRYEYIVLYKKDATSIKIREELIKVSTRLNPQDTFLFYYSGHGSRFESFSGHEADKKDDFLVTSDVSCDDNNIANVIDDDELNYRLSQIKAKKIVVIDACHSETMYKSIVVKSNNQTKRYKGCSKNTFTRAFPKNPLFENASVSNMLFLGAARENESAEGTREGGVFTLALAKALQNNPSSSFGELIRQIQKNIKPIATRLGATGAFVPSLSSEGINPNNLYAKDIFVVPKRESREDFLTCLSRHKGGIDLVIHGAKRVFTFDERVILKTKVANKKGYIYLLDMLDNNAFTILEERSISSCITLRDKSTKQCQFTNLIATAPFGQSIIYAITTDKKIDKNSFESSLKKENFKAGMVSFEVYP